MAEVGHKIAFPIYDMLTNYTEVFEYDWRKYVGYKVFVREIHGK